MLTSRFLKIGLLVLGLTFTSQPAEAQLGKLVKKAKQSVSKTVQKGKEAVSNAVTSSPKEVEAIFCSNTKGIFYPEKNSIIFDDGQSVTLNKDGSITDNSGKKMAEIGDDGLITDLQYDSKLRIDPTTLFVYNDKNVVGCIAERTEDNKEMLTFVLYGYYWGDAFIGDAQKLKKLDLRLPVWYIYCRQFQNKAPEKLEKAINDMKERQDLWSGGSRSDVSKDMIDQIDYALKRQGELTFNGETGKVVEVRTAEKNWNYLRKETYPPIPNSRYMNMWVTLKFNSLFIIRKYLIEQVYKGGDETSDASYGPVTRPRAVTWQGEVIETLYPIYK